MKPDHLSTSNPRWGSPVIAEGHASREKKVSVSGVGDGGRISFIDRSRTVAEEERNLKEKLLKFKCAWVMETEPWPRHQQCCVITTQSKR